MMPKSTPFKGKRGSQPRVQVKLPQGMRPVLRIGLHLS
jgi:hypothetical protein